MEVESEGIQNSFPCLGVILKYNGTFFIAKKKLVDQAQKTILYKIISNDYIPRLLIYSVKYLILR